MAERTGSQLLLDVEQKVELLTKYVRNLDNTVKILLKRMNEVFSQENASSVVSKPSVAQPVQQPLSVQQPTKLEAQKKPKLQKPGDKVKFSELPKTNHFELAKMKAGILDEGEAPGELSDTIEEEFVHKGKQRGRRVPAVSSGTKITVSQLVYTEDGNPLGFAGVEVLDANGNFVKNARTNQNGRWSLPLVPGDYTIRVAKRYPPDSGLDPVEAAYEASIKSSDGPVRQLEDKIIE